MDTLINAKEVDFVVEFYSFHNNCVNNFLLKIC